MGQVRYVVPYGDAVPDPLAKIDQCHKDKGQRDFSFPEFGERCQEDKGESDTAGSQQDSPGKQKIVKQSGNE